MMKIHCADQNLKCYEALSFTTKYKPGLKIYITEEGKETVQFLYHIFEFVPIAIERLTLSQDAKLLY